MKMSVPVLRGERLYIPFVGAIIERTHAGKKQILLQIRTKSTDKKYSECFEIPGGKLRAFEDIDDCLKREVNEECGLEITFIANENTRLDVKNNDDTSSLIVPFCVTQMIEGPFIGLIFICRAQGEPILLTNESKNARWMDLAEVNVLVNHNPERFYTAFLAPIKKYLNSNLIGENSEIFNKNGQSGY